VSIVAGRPIGKRHQEDVRKKIQASQLINVLQNHALGISEDLSQSRLKAIEILLRKSIPDLQSIEMEANVTHKTLAEELAELNAKRNPGGH
jgi:hypothetical protein